MNTIEPRMVRAVMDLRLAKTNSQAETWESLRQIEPAPQNWLSRQRCRLVGQLGCWMVSLGEALERHGLSQAQPLERGAAGN